MKLSFRQLAVASGVGVSMLLMSCSSSGNAGASSVTGWNYNDPDWGGFEYQSGYEQETGPGLVFIEGGTFIQGRVEQDVNWGMDNVPRRVTVASFYIDECEISNANYREWLFWISKVYSEYPKVYKDALPDTLVWRRPLAYNEPYVENYLRHPAYADYPVVGVNWIQASNYCKWRTDRVNEMILVKNGLIQMNVNEQQGQNSFDTEAYLYGQYDAAPGDDADDLKDISTGEARRVRIDDGILLPKYRLPTEAEWEYAALAYVGNTESERLSDRKIFPWNGHVVRNAEDNDRGQMMANFVRGNGDYMGTAGSLNDKGDITVPVKSYWPNDYGLYCMAGNVNEWVDDVYRPLTFDDEEEFNPYRGNVMMKKKLNDNGNVAEKDSLGHIQYVMETAQDIAGAGSNGRLNYRVANNINYLDGDKRSNPLTEWTDSEEDKADAENLDKPTYTEKMYSGTPNSNGLRNLVSDRTRVYKGGGWRDRAYWLSPGTRRFLDERDSRDDLGFRCAMVRVGSPVQAKK